MNKEIVWIVVGVHGAYVDWRHTRKEMKEHHCLSLGLEKDGKADWEQAKAKGDRCVKAILSYSQIKLNPSGVDLEEESQEELWKEVSNEINDEGLWLYDDYVGFTLNAKGFAYLMSQFTITRKKGL